MRFKSRLQLVTFCFLSLLSDNLMAEELTISQAQSAVSGPSTTPDEMTAPDTTTKTNTQVKMITAAPEKKLSIDVDLSSDSNFRSQSDPAFASDAYFSIMPNYKISNTVSISGRVGVDQKLNEDQRTDLADSTLKITLSPFVTDDSRDLKIGLTGVLPTSEVNRLENSFEGGLGASLEFTQRYFTFGLRQKGQAQLSLSGLKNFHQYELTSQYIPNVSHRARELIVISQDLTQALSLSVVAFYQTGWTYQNELKTFFHVDETLSFALNKQISFYIGHSNEANALQNNGIDSNISLYDGYTSIFKAGTTISF